MTGTGAAPPGEAPASRVLPVPDRYDFGRTVGVLRTGRHDPTTRLGAGELWKASRTPDGPGTVHLRYQQAAVTATAFGPGAGWLLARADALAGLRDDAAGFLPLARQHPVVAVLADAMPGIRLARTERVFDELTRAVLAQKVTTVEATRSYAALVRRFAEPAPGPVRLLLPPPAESVATAPYWAFHPLGIEQRRADTLRRLALVADRLERTVAEPPAQARRLLMTRPGIGPWTAAEVSAVAYGDPDAVSVGDYHVPHQVAYALAGEPRGTDQRMLELLAPFDGHRARVVRLVVHAGVQEPRRAPRAPLRSFARF
ncbi:3-methyladenine DNA glycosylase [Actinocatenispora thailandica]|uniref:3-methyladenine DNA glycosylase n=1 Tax=Actinocatenispora thailandica TaxID=227318 RepID=A0A7R7HWQ4_9ACTN|nr:DNA-3-methyladenine glycosylase 2 family protein [Actinocatenispora thailandica]BCJ35133.1 3-methyladenine DNA glycosylase [Actinocatenispora thailandica]